MALLTISGTACKEPSSLDVSYFDLINEGISASGKTLVDVIKLDKIRAKISYNALTVAERDTLRALLIGSYFLTVILGAGAITTSTKTITARILNRSNSIKILSTLAGVTSFEFEIEEQ